MMEGQVDPEVEELKSSGLTRYSDGKSEKRMEKRIQAGGNNWKKVLGLVSEKNIPVRTKDGYNKQSYNQLCCIGSRL